MIEDIIIYTPMYVSAFWAILLLSSYSSGNRAKFLLGIFMMAAMILYVSHAVYFKKNYCCYVYFDIGYTFASLCVYPLYYKYIKLLTIEPFFSPKNVLLLFPAVIVASLTAIWYILMGNEESMLFVKKFHYHQDILERESFYVTAQKLTFLLGRVVFAVQVICFLILGSRLVKRYDNRIANFYSNTEGKSIVWVKLLLWSFVITSAVSIVFNILGRDLFVDSFILVIPSLIFSILLFFIGFQGYLQNHSVADLFEDEKEPSEKKYRSIARDKLKEKLLLLFEEQQVFKQSELRITDLSTLLNTNRTYVSGLINEEFGCTFSEFVNQYRIEEAKQMLNDDIERKYSLDYIASEVGFGSLNSFIRVFKSKEGTTPGKFRL